MTAEKLMLPAHNWAWFMLRGVLALLLGLAAVIFPLSAVFAFTMIFAAYSLIDGIASLVAGMRGASQPGHRWGALIFSGIIGILIGVLFLLMPLVATVAYATFVLAMLAAWAIITGALEIIAAIRLRREMKDEFLLGVSGAISVLLGVGVITLAMPYPAASILSAAWLIAFFAFGTGIVLVAQAVRLKNSGVRIT